MGKTLIKVNCIDQRLFIASSPVIASGGRNENEVEFNFCALWDDCEKTAVFFRDKSAVYHVPIVDDKCVIPHEVIASEGWMYFGVFGVSGDIRRTSDVMKYHIAKGAITEGGLPTDPTSDVYKRYLDSLAKMERATADVETAINAANTAIEATNAAIKATNTATQEAKNAEAERVEAEKQRAETFAGFEGEINRLSEEIEELKKEEPSGPSGWVEQEVIFDENIGKFIGESLSWEVNSLFATSNEISIPSDVHMVRIVSHAINHYVNKLTFVNDSGVFIGGWKNVVGETSEIIVIPYGAVACYVGSETNEGGVTVNAQAQLYFYHGALPTIIEKDAIASGESLFLTVPDIKQDCTIAFSCELGENIPSITVAHGMTTPWASGYVVISANDVKVYKYESRVEVIETHEHGLELSGSLSVVIRIKDNPNAVITLITDGGMFSKDIVWNGCAEDVRAIVNGAGVTEARLSFSCAKYTADVWAYGDSYFDYWPQILTAIGADNWLVDGVSGRGASAALASLRIALQYSKPKYILWCMGMNDADSEAGVNTTWQSVFNEIKAICAAQGIAPIFATVPNTPTINNAYKNAIIRESGNRYVDIDNAVGADKDTAWRNRLLSTDNVHPSENGARVIAARFAVDVPELFG